MVGIVFASMFFVGIAQVVYVSDPFPLPPIITFALATLIGFAGAVVYVAVLLVADIDLNALSRLLENPRISEDLLIPLFLISGGLVAATTQIASGPLTTGDVARDFLLGFGWLGAMSGVGGSASARTKAAEVGKKELELGGKTKELAAKESELKDKTDAIEQRAKEVMTGIEEYTAQLQRRADREVERKLKEVEAFYERLRTADGTAQGESPQ